MFVSIFEPKKISGHLFYPRLLRQKLHSMLDFSNTTIAAIAVHRVGNKTRAERNYFSDRLFDLPEDLEPTLRDYFLKPLKRKEEVQNFRHSSDLNLNEVYTYAAAIFEQPDDLLMESVHVVQHLYNQSGHANIKAGEVCVVHFRDILIDDELVDGLGIFKSERKQQFLRITEGTETLRIEELEGISTEKLDKGALILNTQREDGFRLLTVDNNNYDALYWTGHFLNVDHVADENFHTRLYLELCNEFAEQVVAPASDRRERAKFVASSLDYFNNHDTFDVQEFTQSVVPDKPELQESFRAYQTDFGLNEVEQFNISKTAVRSGKRKLKTTIHLDNNIQIKLNVSDPEGSTAFVERGFDEERGMYFYKVFFNEER